MQVRVRRSSEFSNPRGLICFAAAWAAAFHFCILISIDLLLDPEKETSLRSFVLRDLLPSSVDGYYRYTGSLTTPPCSKVVEWIIFSRPVYLSHSQVCEVWTRTHTHAPRQLYFPCTVRSHLHAVSGSLSHGASAQAGFSPHLLLRSSSSCFPRQPLCLLSQKCLHIVDY